MKMRKRIGNAQLQTELVEMLKNMFLPQKKLIKQQIEWLIEHGFMTRDETDINTFIYVTWSEVMSPRFLDYKLWVVIGTFHGSSISYFVFLLIHLFFSSVFLFRMFFAPFCYYCSTASRMILSLSFKLFAFS